jgi:hypothetical protein
MGVTIGADRDPALSFISYEISMLTTVICRGAPSMLVHTPDIVDDVARHKAPRHTNGKDPGYSRSRKTICFGGPLADSVIYSRASTSQIARPQELFLSRTAVYVTACAQP